MEAWLTLGLKGHSTQIEYIAGKCSSTLRSLDYSCHLCTLSMLYLFVLYLGSGAAQDGQDHQLTGPMVGNFLHWRP